MHKTIADSTDAVKAHTAMVELLIKNISYILTVKQKFVINITSNYLRHDKAS